MAWWIGALLLPACLAGGWILVRRPLRLALDDLNYEQARQVFRYQREWLEARFVTTITNEEPFEGPRWEEADWQDAVHWARDRRSRHLLALVGVQFDANPFSDEDDDPSNFATAVFEYRGGRWRAEGIYFAAMRPHEACLKNQRLVPMVPPPPQARG